MNLHEYQSQELLQQFGIPVPVGELASSVEEALAIYSRLDSKQVVVKAQVHAGGRGQAGGIRIVENKKGLTEVVKNLLGTRLITYQTDNHGQPIDSVYLVKPCLIDRELYLSAVVDRARCCVTFMVCSEGGVDIESTVEHHPEKVYKFHVDCLEGVLRYECMNAAAILGLKKEQVTKFVQIVNNLYDLLISHDLTLVEINPLVITKSGDLLCIDAKINIDDNALYRQPKLRQMRDLSQEDERESQAKKWELNYISLQGNIGCMVNGAGLAMATMDLIKLEGGSPANFLDVGGGVTRERVSEAFKIILSDGHVKAILINIFGGIVRCDLIAEGVIEAVVDMSTVLPVVIRLEGNRADLGRKKLESSGLNIVAASSFSEAARLVVEMAG
ncbi:MAG: ADP-forming succinate--CoA ligase subunit beta [Pseudomonadota bacterium]|nr:ADP-forming succinate--CoA ligase subunit beta [Pseudomonadota bacterium]